jgi:hypothetical protein
MLEWTVSNGKEFSTRKSVFTYKLMLTYASLYIIIYFMIRNKSPGAIKKDIMELRNYYIHPYDFRLQDILYKVLKSWEQQDVSREIEIIFSDKEIYEDYKNMLRKKYMFLKNYSDLGPNEWLLLVSWRWQYYPLILDDKKAAFETFYYTIQSPHHKIYKPHRTNCKVVKVMVENEKWYASYVMPTTFTNRLMSYFKRYQMGNVHDCHDFERHMLWIDYTMYDEIIWLEDRDWNYDTLHIWDSIWLYSTESHVPKHKAIYFWNNLFIAKSKESVLLVSTLDQMHLMYWTNGIRLNRYYRDTNAYKEMQEETIEILKTHPERKRLEQIFSYLGNWVY